MWIQQNPQILYTQWSMGVLESSDSYRANSVSWRQPFVQMLTFRTVQNPQILVLMCHLIWNPQIQSDPAFQPFEFVLCQQMDGQHKLFRRSVVPEVVMHQFQLDTLTWHAQLAASVFPAKSFYSYKTNKKKEPINQQPKPTSSG